MVFAALLSLRKRYRILRIGSARVWMKAHLWLGALALPMVLFHAAFHARGLLAYILMLLTVVRRAKRDIRGLSAAHAPYAGCSAKCPTRPSTTRSA